MTTTARRLVAGSALTAAAAVYYTAPSNTNTIIKAASICNTTAGAVLATVYLVPSGGVAGATNAIINNLSIAANVTYTCPELVNQVIPPGATLQAFGLALTLIASGIEIS